MKSFKFIFLALAFVISAREIYSQEPLKFKAKIGFAATEDQIVEHKFIDGGRKILLVGQKTIQLWDVENAKLLNSVPHQIAQFAPKGFFSTYVLLGLPELFNWKPYFIERDGRWIITVETIGDKRLKSAVVRDLATAKQIALLDLPNVSIDYVAFDEAKNEIVTFGQTDKNAAFANWNPQTFERRRIVAIDDYKWHRFIKTEEKMLVGAGDTKVALSAKQGERLTLRDVKTGAIEREYTAQNLIPDTAFQETAVSADEKFLISKRNDRIFVWAIDEGGAPRFEIARENPKEDLRLVSLIAGRFIVVGKDKKLRIYDVSGSGAPKFEFAAANPKDSVRLLSASKDGRFIAVGDDEKLSVVNATGNAAKPLYEIRRDSEKERFSFTTFIDDDKYFAVSRVNRSEKKPNRTEFYAAETGKIAFEIPVALDYGAHLTPDKKFLVNGYLGGVFVWNLAEKRGFTISLEVYTPDSDPHAAYQVQEQPRNVEHISLSPNSKLILKYGGDTVSIFDIETGREIQTIFDAEKVKYDKRNKIKKSGLGDASWSDDGRYVFAFEQSGFFGKRRTISFWEVSK